MPVPLQRNWLKEAFSIADGSSRLKPKREHIVAALNQLRDLGEALRKLESRIHQTYESERDRRKVAGLPPPPVPPGYMKGPDA